MYETLVIDDVCSLKVTLKPNQVSSVLQQFLSSLGYAAGQFPGTMLSLTHSVEIDGTDQLLVCEFMARAKEGVTVSPSIVRKPRISITNALRRVHLGKPEELAATMHLVQEEIAEKKLTPITPFVTAQHFHQLAGGSMEVKMEVWVGVSPNQL